MNDLISITSTFETHAGYLEELSNVDLNFKKSNVQFSQKYIEYQGHVIYAKGITVRFARVETVETMSTSTCIDDLRSVLGTVDFIQRRVSYDGGIRLSSVEKILSINVVLISAWAPAQDAAVAHAKC